MRLLVVEDDVAIASLLERVLTGAGYDVEVLHEGAGVPARVRSGGIDLLVLDLTLPDVDGLDVCRRVRSVSATVPIMMLTGRGGEIDVVAGLSAGADDYIGKPFRPAELTARIRAHLRAVVAGRPSDEFDDAAPFGLRIETATGRVWMNDHQVALTPTEFQVLAVLVAEVGRAVPRERIIAHLAEQGLSASTRSLDMHIASIRRSLSEGAGDRDPISTVRGVGFRLEPA